MSKKNSPQTHVIGIDIGGTGIKGGIVNLDKGKLVGERFRIDTPQPATPAAATLTIVIARRDLIALSLALRRA